MLPGPPRGHRAGVMATTKSACASAGASWCRRRTWRRACPCPARADELELVFLGVALREEIHRLADSARDWLAAVRGCRRVIMDGADAHLSSWRSAVADAALDEVLEMDGRGMRRPGDSELAAARFRDLLDDRRRSAGGRRGFHPRISRGWHRTAPVRMHDPRHRRRHPGLCPRMNERGVERRHLAARAPVFPWRAPTIARPSGLRLVMSEESCAASARSRDRRPQRENKLGSWRCRGIVPVLSRSSRVDLACGLDGAAGIASHV